MLTNADTSIINKSELRKQKWETLGRLFIFSKSESLIRSDSEGLRGAFEKSRSEEHEEIDVMIIQ